MIIIRKTYKFINCNINTKPVGFVLIIHDSFQLKLKKNANNKKPLKVHKCNINTIPVSFVLIIFVSFQLKLNKIDNNLKDKQIN